MIRHQRVHENLDVEGCFGCQVSSIHFGAAAFGTRSGSEQVQTWNAMEKRWDKDHPAYKSMRREGLQPRTSEGAHQLMMTAESREQIEGLPTLHKDRHEILADMVPTREAG